MPGNSSSTPVLEGAISWHTQIAGSRRKFEIPVFHNVTVTGENSSYTIINLNGIGEGKYSASVAPAEFCGAIVSPILPFQDKDLELTPGNIEKVADEVPRLAAEFAKQLTGDNQNKLGMVARSQGGAVAIRAVIDNLGQFDKLALVMPFGLNRDELGQNAIARRKEILKRIAIATIKANPFDYGNLRSSLEVGSYIVKAALGRRLFSSLDAALTFDLTGELAEIAEHIPVRLFLSESDPLFPAHEIEPKFKGTKVEVVRIKGNHSTPGSREGKSQLAAAYAWMQS